jgi:hypothetical protein
VESKMALQLQPFSSFRNRQFFECRVWHDHLLRV